ncbi:hypothetical protein MKEN_01337600 [Mycena kentingensis (nom. inval.)]|nr:hypothetical protein MKEN_01337600 [Mycena kentingensis (nom. inval.)]
MWIHTRQSLDEATHSLVLYSILSTSLYILLNSLSTFNIDDTPSGTTPQKPDTTMETTTSYHGHSLPSNQRANLIRTTRKLGAILGETPLVVEHQDDHDEQHGQHGHSASVSSVDSKRSGRFFAPPPPRGASLTAAGSPVPSAEVAIDPSRPLLFLRLPNGQGTSPRPRPASTLSTMSIPSPRSPSFSHTPPSPLSPAPRAADRRKKLAKLVRTLGTNVPPELVFAPRSQSFPSPVVTTSILGSLSPSHERERERRRSNRYSADSLASATREAVTSSSSYMHTYAPSHSQSSPPLPPSSPALSTGSDAGSWIDISSPAFSSPPPTTPPHAHAHYIKVSSRGWNASADDVNASAPYDDFHASASTTSRGTHDARFLSKHIEFRGPSLDGDGTSDGIGEGEGYAYASEGQQAQQPSTYRREQGWSGEWSGAGGMEDVVSRLRGLRVK